MKKPLLIILALICVVAACKIDNTGIPTVSNNPLIIGTWFVKSQITNDQTLGTIVSTYFNTKDFYTFNNDNTMIQSTSAPVATVNGHFYYVNNTSGQSITIGTANGNTAYTITKLSADSLIMTTTVAGFSTGTTDPSTLKLAHK